MSQLPIASAIAEESTLLREMHEPLERRLLGPARTVGAELALVGITPVPSRPIVQRTASGTWFFAADYLADAGLREDGALAVPEAELRRLRTLRDAGVSVDLIWIAHELPASWSPGEPLPALVPDARRYRELDQRLERVVRTTFETSFAAVKTTARGLALGALGVGAAFASAGAGLDPVVLGGIRHPQEPVAAWTLLAQWHWE